MHFTELLSSWQCECDCNVPLLYVTSYLHTTSNWASFYEIYLSLFSASTNFFHGINHGITTTIHIQQASWMNSRACKSTQDVILFSWNLYVAISHVSWDLLQFTERTVLSNKPLPAVLSLSTVIIKVLLHFCTLLYPPWILQFLGAFAKLRKSLLASSCLSACPSVRHSVCQHEASRLPLGISSRNFIFEEFFRKSVDRMQVLLKSHKHNGYLTWRPMYIFVISHACLLRMKNVSDKNYRETHNTHFVFNNFFFEKSFLFWVNVEIYCRAGQATDDKMALAHRILGT